MTRRVRFEIGKKFVYRSYLSFCNKFRLTSKYFLSLFSFLFLALSFFFKIYEFVSRLESLEIGHLRASCFYSNIFSLGRSRKLVPEILTFLEFLIALIKK